MNAPVPLLRLLEAARLPVADIRGNPDTVVTGVSTHAQAIERNELFVALTGTKTDSHMLVQDAVRRGAAALLVEKPVPAFPGVCTVMVPDTRFALGVVAQALHGHPTKAMTVTGCTGTNGKTTVTHMVRAILENAGARVGLVGTLGSIWNGKKLDEGMTTPGPIALARTFAAMEADRVDHVVMEASSHAIDQHRISGIPFHVGILTNVTQDHLDYHGSYPAYVAVKRRLFFDHVLPTPGSTCCFNADDVVGAELLHSYPGASMAYSAAGPADGHSVHARAVEHRSDGTRFELVRGHSAVTVDAPVPGAFNLSNMLAAAAAATALGLDLKQIAEGLESFRGAPGRFERIDEGQPFSVLVDYAHTPDALEKVLRTARRITLGRLLCVFGAGGNRDRTKRPLMGRVAGELADHVIVTSDNPRNEDPESIARMVEEGLRQSGIRPAQTQRVLDRRQAIERALNLAGPGDCVIIAGKGHEDYQEVQGVFHHFDDREAAREALRALRGARAVHPVLADMNAVAN